MAKKFVTAAGLDRVFNAVSEGGQQGYDVSRIKDGITAADANSIIFIKDSSKGKFIWAKGELYDCNNNKYNVGNGTLTVQGSNGLSGAGTFTANQSSASTITLSHVTPTGATTTASGFYKISTDAYGHVTGTTTVSKEDITALGIPGSQPTVNNGTLTVQGSNGLSGTGTFTANQSSASTITLSHATPTGATTTTSGFYKIATDAYGHVTGTTTVTKEDITALGIPGSQPTVNNGTLTIKANGTQKGTFTANQSGNTEINITAADLGVSSAMIFKGSLGTGGTVTALPKSNVARIGDTYKVITDGTYAGTAAKVGDTFICSGLPTTPSATAEATWTLIPSGDEPSGTVTSVGLSNVSGSTEFTIAGGPITSSGTLTITHANNVTPITTDSLLKVSYDKHGHVTSSTAVTKTDITSLGIPSNEELIANEQVVAAALNDQEKRIEDLEKFVPGDASLTLAAYKADGTTAGTTVQVVTGTGFTANGSTNKTYSVKYTGSADSDDWGTIS